MNNAARPIPGLFPPPTFLNSGGVCADPLGGLRVRVHTTPSGEARPNIRWVLCNITGKELIRDDTGEKVFRNDLGVCVEYMVITDPEVDRLPVGTCVLHVLVDTHTHREIPIVLESVVFRIEASCTSIFPGVNQVGSFYLQEGETVFQGEYPKRFARPPQVVLTQVIGDASASPILAITPHVEGFNEHVFSGTLDLAPNSAGYRLGWVAWS